MDKKEFLNKENWSGSYYELAMVYAPPREDTQILRAIQAIWQTSCLNGPWVERSHFQGPPELPSELEADSSNWLYGLLNLPQVRSVGCLALTVREEDGQDWLDFCVPTGMLRLVYPIQYPLLRETNPWLDTLDHIFVQLADAVYRSAPFTFAAIGEEMSGMVDEQDMRGRRLENSRLLLSPALFDRIAPDSDGVILSSGLHWFPWTEDH